MNINISLLLALLVVVPRGFADDAPNTKIEKKMAERAKARMGEDTSLDPGVWNMVTSQASQKSYTTRKKESLKEISTMLFGDPQFWGKLWTLNKNITNPYEVPAGTTINFIEATAETPPSIGIVFNAFPSPKDLGDPAGPDLLGATLNVEIPGNSHERPGSIEIPEAFPSWKFRVPAVVGVNVDFSRPVRNIPPAIKALDYFVSETFPDSEGHVAGTEMNLKSASEYQYVYLKFDHEPTEKSYLVVKNLGKLESNFSRRPPSLVQVLGTVQVLEKVDSGKLVYRGMVTRCIDNVSVGGSLIKGSIPTYEFSSTGTSAPANATIIGGHHSTNRNIFGTESVVFLDQGKADGVSEGQILPVYEYHRSHADNAFVKENPRNIGTLKVVKVMEHYSTAVIVSSVSEIEVGDSTAPQLSSAAKATSETGLLGGGEDGESKSDDLGESKKNAGDDIKLDEDKPLEEKPAESSNELKLEDEKPPEPGLEGEKSSELKLDDTPPPPPEIKTE